MLRLKPQNDNIIRVSCTLKEEFEEFLGIGILKETDFDNWDFEETNDYVILSTNKIKVYVDKKSASITYKNKDDKVLLAERSFDSRELEEFASYKTVIDKNTKTETIETPDGKKTVIKEASTIFDRKLYRTRLHFDFSKDEKIFGLGQFEEGSLNYRGTTQ